MEADEGGGADGRAAKVAGLVAGERGDAQEGDGAGAGGSGERVWQPADRRVDGGERDGEQDQPGATAARS